MFRKSFLAAALLLVAAHAVADGASTYSLQALRDAARAAHPSLAAARASVEAGRAQVISAGAYPNPEVEFLAGRTRARVPGATTGTVQSLEVTQRVDNPWQREARIDAAGFALSAREAERRSFENDLLARLDQRFYELLRREAELRAAREDLGLAEQIRSRVAVRVQTGEAPRYELIKADTELLNAQKSAEGAALRVSQARAGLRALVSPALPAEFAVEGSLATSPVVPPLDSLRAEVLARNPELARSQAEVKRAERQLELERLRRHPELAVKVTEERDSELRDSRLGVILSVPLWDRRQGPVAEAGALLTRSRSEQAGQELALTQALEGAYRQYEIARTQVNALENGIIREAEAALKVAEAAYRFGERGILDYLDAQRVFRAARNELIAARYELQLAVIEIERLRAAQ
ncbi:TolC family protein [Zoogloea sp. LCSB751]|uniref:TolC family protein n=1 Tax=Zoogloea sp. LCSB751 TaxID=1965277 RepID=UPI0009A50BB0|nr:TolC family protein [Zoogloea sp. LCSB751]